MHCEFTYTTNAFQDESWDLSNSKGYEGSRIKIRVFWYSSRDRLHWQAEEVGFEICDLKALSQFRVTNEK